MAWLSRIRSGAPVQVPLLEQLYHLMNQELTPEPLATAALELLEEHLRPDICCVYLRRPGDPAFSAVATFPPPYWAIPEKYAKFKTRAANEGAIAGCVQNEHWRLIRDTRTAEEEGTYLPFSHEIRTELLIPVSTRDLLGHRNHVTGIVVLSWKAHITLGQLPPLDLLKMQLNNAFSNAITRVHRDRRLTLLRALGTLNPENTDELLTDFLHLVDEAVPCKFISLWLYDDQEERLAVRAFYPSTAPGGSPLGFDSFDQPILRKDACACGPAVTDGRPLLLPFLPATYANPKLAQLLGLTWMIAIPIWSFGKTPFALLNLYPRGIPEEFEDSLLQLLSAYVSPVASAIRLSQLLFEESLLVSLDDFLDHCFDFDDGEKWWDSLAKDIRSVMQCEGCSIFARVDDELLLRGTTGLVGDPPYATVRYALDPETSSTAHAFSNGSTIYYKGDPDAEISRVHVSRWREKTVGKSRSILFVPIKDNEGRPIALIRCSNKDERPGRGIGVFTSEDRSHLEKVAALVAAAWRPTHVLRERNRARQRTTRAIQHELLGPVQALKDHGAWLHRWEQHSEDERRRRIGLVIADIARHTDLIDMVYSSLGQLDDIRPSIGPHRLTGLIAACRRFLYVEREIKWVELRTGDVGIDWVVCDDLYMMRVLFNMLRNAVKYRNRASTQRYVAIGARQVDDRAVITIEDNGVGVPAGDEERIFLEGERGSNARGLHPSGEGLGLHYCRVIMAAHQGEVVLQSPRDPTIFRLSWPSVPPDRPTLYRRSAK